MDKIAIVNQRYGLEVNGGSEYYTRLIVEHLSKVYELEVLTTAALNYDTWENYYEEGSTQVNGIKVKRFSVKKPRNMLKFRILSKIVRTFMKRRNHLDALWVKSQGPYVPELIQYIKEHNNDYKLFIFVTYLYYSTVMGLPEVAEKAVLIPTAHDEPYIYFPIYQKIFTCPKGIIYLTEEEREFVQQKFGNSKIKNDVIGVGIDIPEKLLDLQHRCQAKEEFCRKYKIENDYIVYAGRIDYGKNCDEMFKYFINYKNAHKENRIQLVVIGKSTMDIPDYPDIHYLGFVSEEEKYVAIASSVYLWMPSQFESLSIALLESMALGIPGIVNGKCEVLKGHCLKSKGAVFYTDEDEYADCMGIFYGNKEYYKSLCTQSKNYVEENYQWNVIEDKLVKMIENL